MRWKTLCDQPFAGGVCIPAGTVLTEVWGKEMSDEEKGHIERARMADRKAAKPASIAVRWEGQLRFLSPLELLAERLLVIDTETTGMQKADPEKNYRGAQVIEIAVVLLEWGEETFALDRLVYCDPTYMTGQGWGRAHRVHGIPKKDVLKAINPQAVGRRLARWYRTVGSPPCTAYGVSFDKRVIAQTWPSLSLFWHPSLCIMKQWRAVKGTRPPKLTTAAGLLGVDNPEGVAHRALFDARLAARVHRALHALKVPTPTPRLGAAAQAAEDRIQHAMGVG